ncbi:hypothetical protein FHL15_007996 [Xylaria flabelliformis]|uniref:Uncharacterized protein n=1 Tax=Xylaria flabelliformis TaxID=2512241 RepID=A0A553HSV4_9PEZI|nr:hypothetical protein FHL15_007996 [Xylaria flabelliformis]
MLGYTEDAGGRQGCEWAEGYPFPSNLDKQQPGANGMAPPSEVDMLWEGLQKGWDTSQVVKAVKQLKADSMY